MRAASQCDKEDYRGDDAAHGRDDEGIGAVRFYKHAAHAPQKACEQEQEDRFGSLIHVYYYTLWYNDGQAKFEFAIGTPCIKGKYVQNQ